MNIFPVDSLITSIGADGLPVYDRPYTSADLRKVYETFFSNGVFMEDPDSLRVVASGGMNVTVGPGICHIKGAFGYEAETRTLVLQAADTTLDRISSVVVRLNLNVNARSCELFVIDGTPSHTPQPPSLTRNATIYEIGLANIFVPAASGALTQQRITDTRLDTTRCGAVVPFAPLDTTKIYQQLQDQVNSNIDLIQSAVDNTTAGLLSTYTLDNESLTLPHISSFTPTQETQPLETIQVLVGTTPKKFTFKNANPFPYSHAQGSCPNSDGGFLYIDYSKNKHTFALYGNIFFANAGNMWSKMPYIDQTSGLAGFKLPFKVAEQSNSFRKIGAAGYSINAANGQVGPGYYNNTYLVIGKDGYLYAAICDGVPSNRNDPIIYVYTGRIVNTDIYTQ